MKRRSCLSALTLLAANGWPGTGRAAEADALRRLRFSMTLVNPFQYSLRDQRLWCYLPANLPPGQVLRKVSVSMPHRIESDAWGHRILALELADLSALSQRVVNIQLELGSAAEEARELPARQLWLADERYIERGDARMVARARQLQRATPMASARAIFEWVQQHMHYAGYVAEDLGALYALTRASGDCTEYAYLVVALARALEIPARMVGGYVQSEDKILRAADYHNWAEMHLDGRWMIVDAQKGNFLPDRAQYVAFRLYRAEAVNSVGLAHRYWQDGQLQIIL